MNKKIYIGVILSLISLILVFFSCKKDEPENTESKIDWECLGCSECKTKAEYNKEVEFNDDNEELIMSYDFDMNKGEGFIIRKNLNLMDCDADPYSEVYVYGDTISIYFQYDLNGGKCMCFFDITTKIKGLKPQVYYIDVHDQQMEYDFVIDLAKCPRGKFYW